MNTLNKKAAMSLARIMKGFKGIVPDLRALTPFTAWGYTSKTPLEARQMIKQPGALRRNILQAAALQAVAGNKYIKNMPGPAMRLNGGIMLWKYPRWAEKSAVIPSNAEGYTKGLLIGKNNSGLVDEAGFRQLMKNNPDATAADIFRKAYSSGDTLVPVQGHMLKPGQISSYLGYKDFHNAMRETKAFKQYMRLTYPQKFPFSHLFHGSPVTTIGQMAGALRNIF